MCYQIQSTLFEFQNCWTKQEVSLTENPFKVHLFEHPWDHQGQF
jgi:hypothetical protein